MYSHILCGPEVWIVKDANLLRGVVTINKYQENLYYSETKQQLKDILFLQALKKLRKSHLFKVVQFFGIATFHWFSR